MPFVRALDRMSSAPGLALELVHLAVELAADRPMPVLVAFVLAMRRVDRVHRAFTPISNLVGFFIDIPCDLRDLHTGDRPDDSVAVAPSWHRGARWNFKSAKRNRQHRANDNFSVRNFHIRPPWPYQGGSNNHSIQ